MDIGWCDRDGILHCSFCEWSRKCTTVEEAEFRFVEHIKEHGHATVLRRNPNTGEATELTDSEES